MAPFAAMPIDGVDTANGSGIFLNGDEDFTVVNERKTVVYGKPVEAVGVIIKGVVIYIITLFLKFSKF